MFGIQESKDKKESCPEGFSHLQENSTKSPVKKKDSYHDICHNKSLAFSFDTDVSQHRLTVSNPHGMFLFQIPRRFATPFYLLR